MYKYYIRQVGYLYDDSCMELVEGFGGLTDGFDDFEVAKKELRKKTRASMLGLQIMNYSPIAYLPKKEKAKIAEALAAYLIKTFGEKGIVRSSFSDGYVPDWHYELPMNLTEEQAWKIRKITKLKFCELIEVKEYEPTFWCIQLGKMNEKEEWYSVDVACTPPETGKYTYKEIPQFFSSRAEAFDEMKEDIHRATYGLPEEGLKGTLEELSSMPNILKSFIEQHEKLNYDENNKRLTNVKYLDKEKLLILNSLLKEKIVDIVPFSIEEALELGTKWHPVQ